jgi:flagellar hook-length control protein FliK
VKLIKPTEIIQEFSKIIQAGEKQSMTFQLTPENLGKVKLIVDLVGNQINTRIEVENDQVKQFIQSNVEQLKQNLQSSGVHLSNVNVSLAESEQKFTKAFTHRRKMGEKISRIKEGDDTTRRSQKTLGYNTYEFLA